MDGDSVNSAPTFQPQASPERVAVTGVASGVFRWEEAERAFLGSEMKPDLQRDDVISDLHAPSAYRINIAQVLFKKAAQQIKNNS